MAPLNSTIPAHAACSNPPAMTPRPRAGSGAGKGAPRLRAEARSTELPRHRHVCRGPPLSTPLLCSPPPSSALLCSLLLVRPHCHHARWLKRCPFQRRRDSQLVKAAGTLRASEVRRGELKKKGASSHPRNLLSTIWEGDWRRHYSNPAWSEALQFLSIFALVYNAYSWKPSSHQPGWLEQM